MFGVATKFVHLSGCLQLPEEGGQRRSDSRKHGGLRFRLRQQGSQHDRQQRHAGRPLQNQEG